MAEPAVHRHQPRRQIALAVALRRVPQTVARPDRTLNWLHWTRIRRHCCCPRECRRHVRRAGATLSGEPIDFRCSLARGVMSSLGGEGLGRLVAHVLVHALGRLWTTTPDCSSNKSRVTGMWRLIRIDSALLTAVVVVQPVDMNDAPNTKPKNRGPTRRCRPSRPGRCLGRPTVYCEANSDKDFASTDRPGCPGRCIAAIAVTPR
jgi:hypothetical protein